MRIEVPPAGNCRLVLEERQGQDLLGIGQALEPLDRDEAFDLVQHRAHFGCDIKVFFLTAVCRFDLEDDGDHVDTPETMRGGRKLQEGAILSQQELLFLGERVILAAKRVRRQPCPVGLVLRKAGHVVDAIGKRAGAFVGGEIADQVGTAARNGQSPVPGIFLELGLLGRVDVVADNTGQHGGILFGRGHAKTSALPSRHVSITLEL